MVLCDAIFFPAIILNQDLIDNLIYCTMLVILKKKKKKTYLQSMHMQINHK